jgi:hypothetical protein
MESSIPFNVQCTVGATNIYHVPDLQKHLIESSLMKPDRFTMNMLVAPENLSTRVLPIGYKSLVCDRISKHRAWLTERGYLGYPVKQWEEAAAFMMLRDRSSLFGSFLDYHRMLDARRKQDTFAAFPELKMAEAMHAPPSSR